mmetsp:Transcript_10693/g.15856  ORF Transcript_10693/g.15856 Transcript_10693/m.15856 type:complete len:82 (+) Transcript_10693:216-461(+)
MESAFKCAAHGSSVIVDLSPCPPLTDVHPLPRLLDIAGIGTLSPPTIPLIDFSHQLPGGRPPMLVVVRISWCSFRGTMGQD